MVAAGRSPHAPISRLIRLALPLLLLGGLLSGCGDDYSGQQFDLDAHVKAYEAYEFPADLAFDESEWITKTDYPMIGSPKAVRVPGKRFRIPLLGYPTTLRTHGPNSNSVLTRGISALLYEGMLQLHPETEELIPCLASHWQVENHEDGTQTFTFRLDERARWANGEPVEADDVYYTWWHRVQEDRKDPMSLMSFKENFEEPEVLDRLTIRVKTTEANWRLLLYFGAMQIYPAPYVKMAGEDYLKAYNWRYPIGTGPYVFDTDKMRKGESMLLRRRNDWWGENEGWGKGTYNFDEIEYLTVRDREMVYERFKKGEIDYFLVGMARRWVEDIPKEPKIQKGWIQKRKVYNQQPVGFSGLCFNMRKPPFDEIKVRLAFAHLFNRERLMDKLFFNQYEFTNSIFPGRDWGNGEDRPRVEFDPDRAEELLAEAGFKERDAEGYLVDADGKRLEVTLAYVLQSWERIWLPVKEDYEDAGIKFNLKLMDSSTLSKKISERQFRIHWQMWGSILFPNPETSWRSDLATQNYNNNIPGFQSKEVDRLCEEYNVAKTWEERKRITREIDTLVCAEHPYAFSWYSSNFRILFWDRLGHPKNYVTRVGDDLSEQMILLWWFDEEAEKRLKAAQAADETIPQREGVVKPWAKKD